MPAGDSLHRKSIDSRRSCKGDETLEIDSVCEGHFVEDENELVLLQVGWDGFGKKCDIFETTWSWRT